MSERDLDSLIDEAAEDIVGREPSRNLRGVVLARLHEKRPTAPGRLVWAAAGVMLCGVIATIVTNRTLAPSSVPQFNGVARRSPVELPPHVEVRGIPATEAMPSGPTRRATRIQLVAFLPNESVWSMEPISSDPVGVPVIEIVPLENEATSVNSIRIVAHDRTSLGVE